MYWCHIVNVFEVILSQHIGNDICVEKLRSIHPSIIKTTHLFEQRILVEVKFQHLSDTVTLPPLDLIPV